MRLAWVAVAVGLVACGGAAPASQPMSAAPKRDDSVEREKVRRFAALEDHVLELLSAADPRLALRTGATASEKVLRALGMSAVLAEDASAYLRGESLDLFSFAGRGRELETAKKDLLEAGGGLPERGPRGTALDRPTLEAELLGRVIEEEGVRLRFESSSAAAASELVRALVVTWTPVRGAEEANARDVWLSIRIEQMTVGIREQKRFSYDLEDALDPFERLLDPAQFPKATAQLVELHAFRRSGGAGFGPATERPDRESAHAHLGAPRERGAVETQVEEAIAALDARLAAKGASEHGDRVVPPNAPCPLVATSRVRSMKPPPEREPICSALVALAGVWDTPDEVLLLRGMRDAAVAARAILTGGTPPFGYEVLARARPLLPLGVALAARLLFRDAARARSVLEAWLAFGEAPLDVVEKEGLSPAPSSPAAPRP
jgi:hypothetical protein